MPLKMDFFVGLFILFLNKKGKKGATQDTYLLFYSLRDNNKNLIIRKF